MKYMPKPCGVCPFKLSVKPFITPDRAREIALMSKNLNNTFPCSKTASGIKECAGFLTLQWHTLHEKKHQGFTPSIGCYTSIEDMMEVFENPNKYFK